MRPTTTERITKMIGHPISTGKFRIIVERDDDDFFLIMDPTGYTHVRQTKRQATELIKQLSNKEAKKTKVDMLITTIEWR